MRKLNKTNSFFCKFLLKIFFLKKINSNLNKKKKLKKKTFHDFKHFKLFILKKNVYKLRKIKKKNFFFAFKKFVNLDLKYRNFVKNFRKIKIFLNKRLLRKKFLFLKKLKIYNFFLFFRKLFSRFISKGKKKLVIKYFSMLFLHLKKKIKIKKFSKSNRIVQIFLIQIMLNIVPLLNSKYTNYKGKKVFLPWIELNNKKKVHNINKTVISWIKKSVDIRKEKNVFLRLFSELLDIRKKRGNSIQLKKLYYYEFIKSKSIRKVFKSRIWI